MSDHNSPLLQVTNILQTGTMTKENTEYLAGMRDKMGLSKEQAEKIIKGVQNQRLLGMLKLFLSEPLSSCFQLCSSRFDC